MSNNNLTRIRHELHRLAEMSGQEHQTAGFLAEQLEDLAPDKLVTDLGGCGVAAEFAGQEEGPTVLLRCDMDALPLPDREDLSHASIQSGVSHKCGHDGHMTMLLGLARSLRDQPLAAGKALLLFQPAEENGTGARKVLDDPRFASLAPDIVLGVHNLPGYPLGTVVVKEGPFAAASSGLTIEFTGASSHAAEPQNGRSPVLAIAALAQMISALPQFETGFREAAKATIVGMEAGGPAFGTSPGSGRIMITLRTFADDTLEHLGERCGELAASLGDAFGLRWDISWSDHFPLTANDGAVLEQVIKAAEARDMPVVQAPRPFAWSEDFGHFTSAYPGALVGLGAGEDHPALHHPDYDFPDELIPHGTTFWRSALDHLVRDHRKGSS